VPGDAFWEFERAGWQRAADRYEECWTDTGLFVEPLLDAAGVRAGHGCWTWPVRGLGAVRAAPAASIATLAVSFSGAALDALRAARR
jgi:hypothetical protein